MKSPLKLTKFAVLALAFVFVFSMAIVPHVSATGPTATISPSSGPGHVYVNITGTGFTPNGQVYISAYPYYTFYADSSGNFTHAVYITAEWGPGQSHFYPRDVTTGAYSNTVTYTLDVAPPTGARVTHDNIFINGNSAFTVGNGVNGGGTGTAINPFIIENWSINVGGDNAGINIRNTTSYFIIRNCIIENAENAHYGIVENNVSNGRVEYNVIKTDMLGGVLIHGSSYDNVTANDITTIDRAVELVDSNNCVIFANTLLGTGPSANTLWLASGALALGSHYNLVANNTLHTTHDDASVVNITVGGTNVPTLTASSNNTITNNVCGGAGVNIYIGPAAATGNNANTVTNNLCENTTGIYASIFIRNNYVTVTGNISKNNASPGLEIDGQYDFPAGNNHIENNTFENNNYGVYVSGVYSGTNNVIILNHLRNNTTANAYDSRTNAWFFNGAGNYWGDWQTPDIYLPIGVVDTPRSIAGGSNYDSYPLIEGYFVPENTTPNIFICAADISNAALKGVDVWIDNTYYGNTGATNQLSLAKSYGTYTITMSKVGYNSTTQTFTFDVNHVSTTLVLTTTTISPFTIAIWAAEGNVALKGVDFWIDNLYIGNSGQSNGLSIPNVTSGTHTITATKSGYNTAQLSIIVDVSHLSFTISLVSDGTPSYNIVLNAISGGAALNWVDIWVDGIYYTNTFEANYLNIPTVAAGTYTILMTKSGYVNKTETITVDTNHTSFIISLTPTYTTTTTTTTPPVDNTGNIDLIGLVAPLVGGDRTMAGIAIGAVGVALFAIMGLGVIAGGRSKEYANLVLILFAMLGVFVVTLLGFWPWWILISLIALFAFIIAFR